MISEDFKRRLRRLVEREVYELINACKPNLDADIEEDETDREYWLHIHVFKAKRKSRVLETLKLLEDDFISPTERRKRMEEEREEWRKKREGVSLASLFK